LATHEIDYINLHNTHVCYSAQQNKAAYQQEQLTTFTSPENIYDEVTRIIIDCDGCSTYWQNNFDFLWI